MTKSPTVEVPDADVDSEMFNDLKNEVEERFDLMKAFMRE